MAAKLAVVFAALCFAQVYCKPSDPTDPAKELANSLQSLMGTLNEEMNKALKETPQLAEFKETFTKNTEHLSTKLSELVNTANTEIKANAGEAKKVLDDLTAKMTEAAENVKKAYPTEAAKAEEYKHQLQSAYADVTVKAKEAMEAVAKDTTGLREEVNKVAGKVLETVSNSMKQFQHDLKETLDKNAAKH